MLLKKTEFRGIQQKKPSSNAERRSVTPADIEQHIPKDLPKLMTIDKFHYESVYTARILPSEQETYQLIAKVLVSRNPSFWKPTKPANNHWTNWELGNL